MVLLLCPAIATQWHPKTASQDAAAITALRDIRSQHIGKHYNHNKARQFTILLQPHAQGTRTDEKKVVRVPAVVVRVIILHPTAYARDVGSKK
jgi:hypothetical protein